MNNIIDLSAIELITALACGQACCEPARRKGAGNVHCPVPAHGGDERPSLSVRDANGTILVHCHGGCANDAVIATLRERGLWNGATSAQSGPLPARRPRELPKVDAIYRYPGLDGIAHYRVVRYEGKRFEVWHANGSGWLRGLGDAELVPYRLPELAAARPDVLVFVAEGEKVVDRLASHGLVATCNAFGALKWRPEWGAKYLSGRRVIVLPDNDEVGRKHAAAVADSCYGHAVSVRILALEGLAEHGDVVDWLDAGHDVAELARLVEAAAEHKRTPVARTEFPCTDMGNAERLVARHGDDLRYVATRGQWYAWDGRRWRPDDTGEAERRTKDTHRAVYAEAEGAKDAGRRKELAAHAVRSEASAKVSATLALARFDPKIAMRAEALDASAWLFNTLTGTIDLKSGELRPHRREDLITMVAPVAYDPDARLELWDRFLGDITGGDDDLQRFLQKAAGMSLCGETSEERIFMPIGRTASGKTTLAEALRTTWGDYAAVCEFDTFVQKRDGGGPRNDIARLDRKRLALAVEVDEGKRLAEGLVKLASGGDTLTARFLHQEFFEFVPTFHIWLFSNVAPRVSDEDEGIWRRVSRLPLDHPVPVEKRDPQVKATLRNPRIAGPAILAWAVRGSLAWQREGLGSARVIDDATSQYRKSMDPVAPFLEDRCAIEPGAWTSSDDLYRAYTEWARAAGEHTVLTKIAFARRLTGQGFEATRRGHSRARAWSGVRLRDQQRFEMTGEAAPTSDGGSELPW